MALYTGTARHGGWNQSEARRRGHVEANIVASDAASVLKLTARSMFDLFANAGQRASAMPAVALVFSPDR
jgi:hypothetical protein